jgi:hypothetical protein
MSGMRTRLLAAMTAAILTAPFLTAAAHAASPEHKCPNAVGAEHKCGGKGKG